MSKVQSERLTAISRLVAAAFGTVVLCYAGAPASTSQAQGSREKPLNDIYADESHCLVAPEIRSDKDDPISCFCRDAIVDARYVWRTYLATPVGSVKGRDENLNGVELTLQINAQHMCGEKYDVQKAVRSDDWKWSGPEVVRTYPPDNVLLQIKPDSHGMIQYEYSVVLLQRGSSGGVVKTESFTARDMIPPEVLKNGAKPSTPTRGR